MADEAHVHTKVPIMEKAALAAEEASKAADAGPAEAAVAETAKARAVEAKTRSDEECARKAKAAKAQHAGKGLGWSEEEHELFLQGLEKFGKGKWAAIQKHIGTKSYYQARPSPAATASSCICTQHSDTDWSDASVPVR